MGYNIPYFHYDHPSKKLTSEWAMKVVQYHWYNQTNNNLLHDKKIDDIESWSSGDIKMEPFKKMFKSLKNRIKNAPPRIDGSVSEDFVDNGDTTGLSWQPLPMKHMDTNQSPHRFSQD